MIFVGLINFLSKTLFFFANKTDGVDTGSVEDVEEAGAVAHPSTPPSTLTFDAGTPHFADILIAYATIPGQSHTVRFACKSKNEILADEAPPEGIFSDFVGTIGKSPYFAPTKSKMPSTVLDVYLYIRVAPKNLSEK